MAISAPHRLGTDNEAPEGCYVDLSSDGTIRALAEPTYGFSISDFAAAAPTTVYYADANKNSIINAINQARANGGGIVRIAAGTITWTGVDYLIRYWSSAPLNVALPLAEVLLPSNVLLEGAGIGQTIINYTGPNQAPFGAWDSENIVVRDMTINGAYYGVAAYCCTNVLFERLQISGGWINVQFKYSQDVTVRYCTSINARGHGIGNKDFTERRCGQTCTDVLAEWNSESNTHGVIRTTSCAIYSNVAYGASTGMGIDTHAQYTEICGNHLYNNYYGGKCYDSSYLKFHHNRMISNRAGWWLSASNTCKTYYQPKWIWITKNKFENSGTFSIYGAYRAINAHPTDCQDSNPLRDPTSEEVSFEDIILNDNIYTGNSFVNVEATTGWLPVAELRIPSGATETGLISASRYTVTSDSDETDTFEDSCSGDPQPIVADFDVSASSGNVPLSIDFTDASTADSTITAWKWEYSRNSGSWVQFSTAEDPTYEFALASSYTIRLTVTSADGSDSYTRTITATAASNDNTEILSNGDFASGTSDWSTYTNGTASFSAASGALVATVTNGSTNTQLYQIDVPVTAGETYTLSFDAYANAACSAPVHLHLHASPYTNLGLSETASLTTSSQRFTYQFTATATTTGGRLRFVFNGLSSKTITIDNVSLKSGEIDTGTAPESGGSSAEGDHPDNLVAYGGDGTTDGWAIYDPAPAGTYSLTSYDDGTYVNLRVQSTTVNGAAYLRSDEFSLTNGQDYVVTWHQSGDVQSGSNVEVYTTAGSNCGLDQVYNHTESGGADYEYSFTANQDTITARLRWVINYTPPKDFRFANIVLTVDPRPAVSSRAKKREVGMGIQQPMRGGLSV